MLKLEMWPIEKLKPYEKNPRINEDAVGPAAESIEKYGFLVPMVIKQDGTIASGHTRLKVAKQVGLKEVPCIIADHLNDVQIRGFRIADNKTHDFSIWDNKLLLEEYKEILGIDNTIFTGFTESEILESVLDESSSKITEDDDFLSQYEIVFKSNSKERIERIRDMWDSMEGEYGSGQSFSS